MASWTWTIVQATEGSDGIALGSLLAKTGYTTFDGGFVNTASTKSAITYIDGDAGILRYRGYPIEQLAEKSTFIEVSYLLIYGELPTDRAAREVHHPDPAAHPAARGPQAVLRRLPAQRPPDAGAVQRGQRALERYYQDSLDPLDPEQVELSTIRLLAKLPTIAAYAYKKSVGQPFLYPDNSLTLVENFLRMTFGFPAEPYEVDPEIVRALDMLLILHADHEQNCSTSTVRLVGLVAGQPVHLDLRWHQRAVGPAARRRQPGRAGDAGEDPRRRRRRADFVSKVKNREDGVKLMGFGHRVYKNYDPRARIVKEKADKILGKLGGTTSCSTSPRSSRRSRSPTTTSSSASSTRTSTTTPA